MTAQGDLLHVVTLDRITDSRRAFGKLLIWGSAAVMFAMFFTLWLSVTGWIELQFETWRPALYAYVFWAICLCVAQVVLRGEQGKRVLFVLPAVLFVVAMVVFPLLFGLTIAFSDWNLASLDGRKFNGLDNIRQM